MTHRDPLRAHGGTVNLALLPGQRATP